jgi:hypothetical protein
MLVAWGYAAAIGASGATVVESRTRPANPSTPSTRRPDHHSVWERAHDPLKARRTAGG